MKAAVNPLDWHAMRGKPFFYRFSGAGILKPKNRILGADVAGVIESTGKNVKRFKAGDEVFGDLYWNGLGAYVTGVCSARNMGMVYSLGADRVID